MFISPSSQQRFKLRVAAGVLTADNADLAKMRADQLTQFLSDKSNAPSAAAAPPLGERDQDATSAAAAAAAAAAPGVGGGAQVSMPRHSTLIQPTLDALQCTDESYHVTDLMPVPRH